MAAKKMARTAKAQAKSIVSWFEGTIVEQPIIIADKALLAGLGLVSQVRSDFDEKFEKLAKDGEKVRKQAEGSFESLSDRYIKEFKATSKQLTKRVESVVNTVLEYSPVATTSDLKKLNSKLDKVLAQVVK